MEGFVVISDKKGPRGMGYDVDDAALGCIGLA